MKSVNMGGLKYKIEVEGLGEIIEKLNEYNRLLSEAKSLSKEIASLELVMKVNPVTNEQEDGLSDTQHLSL